VEWQMLEKMSGSLMAEVGNNSEKNFNYWIAELIFYN
jgi:hypothetical protein